MELASGRVCWQLKEINIRKIRDKKVEPPITFNMYVSPANTRILEIIRLYNFIMLIFIYFIYLYVLVMILFKYFSFLIILTFIFNFIYIFYYIILWFVHCQYSDRQDKSSWLHFRLFFKCSWNKSGERNTLISWILI